MDEPPGSRCGGSLVEGRPQMFMTGQLEEYEMANDNNTFDRLLATGRPLVADGAMGTTLFSLGLEGGGCPELLNVEQPDLVEKVHRGFIDAGSDIILTNTFSGNRLRLA